MMDTGLTEYILAIVTTQPDKVQGGGCPVFIARDEEEMDNICLYLARILGGIVHDLENEVKFIAKH